MNPRTQSRWSLASTGNRVMYAVVLAVIAYAATRNVLLFLAVAGLSYVVLTLIGHRHRRQAGSDRQP